MIDLENPFPGVMATKIQKIITKFTQNAPAGRMLAFHWNRYSFDKLIFLKYFNNIIIFDIVNKYLTPDLVTSNNPKFVSNILEFMSNIHDSVLNSKILCQTIFSWCQIICQIFWHQIIKFRYFLIYFFFKEQQCRYL